MRAVIDRFEGDFAICEKEDRSMLNVKRSKLPVNIKEGDVLIIDGDTIKIDSAETAKKRGITDKLVENLWNEDD